MRGVAALLVMWCHLKYNLGRPAQIYADEPWLATDLGAIGVDIFFVISGFVIAMSAVNLGQNWRAFLARRFARVAPLYFVVSSYLLLLVPFGQFQSDRLFRQLFNTFAFIPLFDLASFTNPLCVNGWTLSFEIWFYLSFAGLMAFAGGRRAGTILPAFMAAGVLITGVFYHSEYWFLPKFLFHPLTLEFCAGCILYHARNWMGTRTLCLLCILLPIFLFFANQAQSLGIHAKVLNNPLAGLHRAGVWGGFATCLVGIMTQIDLKHTLNWPKAFLLIGDASYSIYLIAALIMPTFRIFTSMLIAPAFNPSPLANGVIYVAGTVVGGILCWKYFEVPATLKAKTFLARFVPKTT